MSKIKKVIEALLDEEHLHELANIDPSDTGLFRRIWIQVDTKHRHKRPRLKVEGSDKELYPVSIDDPVQVLGPWPPGFSATEFKKLQRFIVLNRETLLAYWNDQRNTKTTLRLIQSI